MDESSGELRMVPVASIRENPAALRSVSQETEDFEQLRDSIANKGILKPLLGVDAKDPESGESFVSLVDGLQRFTAAKMVGLSEVPMLVKNMDEAAIYEAQLEANIHTIKTKPVEYAKQLTRILSLNPTLTIAELAGRISMSDSWVSQRLKLINLNKNIADMVDNGDISASSAIWLAKIPNDEQQNWVEAAQTEDPGEFVAKVNAHLREVKKAQREGRSVNEVTFEDVIQPVSRKKSELLEELNTKATGNMLCNKFKITSPEEAFHLGIQWAMQMDPDTLEVKRAKFEQEQAEKEEKKRKRQEERAAKREEKLAAAEAEG